MKRLAVVFVLIVNIAAFYYGIWRVDYEILFPGGLIEVEDKVTIEDSFAQEGSFNTVFVYSVDRPTKMMLWMTKPLIGVESYEMNQTTSKLSGSELRLRGQLLYETGLEYSLIHAFVSAEKEIDYSLEYISVVYYDPDYNNVPIGLEITGLNGVDVESYTQFIEDISTMTEATLNTTEGDFPIKRNGDYFGFTITPNYLIESSEVAYEFEKSNTAGSSGGLLQTLSIFNMLTETDYTYGLKIAGTGTISVTGHVGPIGGVEQKVIAAAREEADVFFVPEQNYEDAVAANEALKLNLNIVKVTTFEEAVTYLKEMR